MQYLEIEKITPYAKNPRKNQDIDKVASSIKEYGFQQPIVLDKDNIIIVGHTRFSAAKKLGLKKVPCLIADKLTDSQVKAYRIADNRVAEESKWDNELLNLELIELQKDNIDLENLGFENAELEKIFSTNDPLFVSPLQAETQEIPQEIEDFIPSQVRMIQLFLNSGSEPKFKDMISSLQDRYNTDNLTDTVFKAIEYEYNNSTE